MAILYYFLLAGGKYEAVLCCIDGCCRHHGGGRQRWILQYQHGLRGRWRRLGGRVPPVCVVIPFGCHHTPKKKVLFYDSAFLLPKQLLWDFPLNGIKEMHKRHLSFISDAVGPTMAIM